jgi:beta-phosphoglucomutase
MDGVLLDAMPFHADAFEIAFKEIAGFDIDKKDVYLLEGMPGPDLIKEILRKNGRSTSDQNIIKRISERKKDLFKQNEKAKPFEGVKELLRLLKDDTNCVKAVVSGASENEVKSLLQKNGLLSSFELVISGEDLEEGKPSPEPFVTALKKLGLKTNEALVVENSPLGVNSAVKADIQFIVTLNNTPLQIDDFKNLPKDKERLEKVLFKDTKSATSYLVNWCGGGRAII